MTWNGSQLAFTIAVGAGANGLQALVPNSFSGAPISGITLNGAPVTFTVQTIKGVVYAGMVTRYVVELDRGGELQVVRQNLETSSAEALLLTFRIS